MNPSPYPAPFTSAHNRALIVKILLIVGAIVTGCSLIAEAVSLALPPLTEDQELGDNPTGLAVSLVIFLLAVLGVMVYLATVVFFCIWLYRAYANLRVFNPWRRLDSSPGMAVGSFFIPFANLILPYRAVKEVWQKSGPPDDVLPSEPGAPSWFPLWWTFWLLSSFADNISLRASFNENVAEQTATVISIVASALSVVAGLLAYMIVDLIDDKQEETSGKMRLGKFSGPPPPPTNVPMSEVVAPTS